MIPKLQVFTLFSAYTLLKSHISCIYILLILRFAKNCTHENKDTTFDHKIVKFDTRENFSLYGMQVQHNALVHLFYILLKTDKISHGTVKLLQI